MMFKGGDLGDEFLDGGRDNDNILDQQVTIACTVETQILPPRVTRVNLTISSTPLE